MLKSENIPRIRRLSELFEAVIKYVYLSIHEATKSCSRSIREWGEILNQFIIMFENKINP
jgi:transposase-like protein